jgi:hypothetical protein
MNKFTFCGFLCALCFIIACGDGLIEQNAVDPSTVIAGSLTDSRDGRTYKTVTIGTQTWMAQNLNYETVRTGTTSTRTTGFLFVASRTSKPEVAEISLTFSYLSPFVC